MGSDVERRLERTLARIARRGVLGDGLLLGTGSADNRRAERAQAERAVGVAGREVLVAEARVRVRSAIDDTYGARAVGSMFGSPGDPASGEQRAAIVLALDDLVLAAAAEDLIDQRTYRTLSGDGEALLGRSISSAAAYERAGIEVGEKIDPVAAPWAAAQLIAGVVAAIILGPITVLFAWDAYGTLAGIIAGLAVVAGCVAWAVWPRRRRLMRAGEGRLSGLRLR